MQKGLRKVFMVPLFILGFVLMGLFSGYLTFKIMSFSKTVEVPDLKGKTVIEANDILNKAGLYLKVEGEDYDPSVAPGRIVRQDVPSGNKVKVQRGIKVFLSKGPRIQYLPDLLGLSLPEAESVLVKSGLRVEKIIHVHSSTVGKDTVLSQRPHPEEAVKDALSLVISAGPYSILYYCPDFAGKSKEEASSLAEQLGLAVEFEGQGGRVRTQKPAPETLVRTGDTIHLQMEGEPSAHG